MEEVQWGGAVHTILCDPGFSFSRHLDVLDIGFWKKFRCEVNVQIPNDDEKRLLQQVSNDVEGESSKRSREWSLNGAEVV